MKSQTSLIAQQVRPQQWATQIHDCQNRPENMDVQTWCDLNGLAKANYYYRLRRVREACIETTRIELATFVEVDPQIIAPDLSSATDATHNETAAVLHGANGLTLDILPSASADMLKKLFQVMAHVE